jgi:hypothetical protein
MQPGIWTDAEALVVEWNTRPPCHLLQVVGIVEASTSRKRNQHHARLELSKLTQDRNDIWFLQLQPHVVELGTSHKLHENILRLRSVVRRRRVIINLRNRQPRGTEETHFGHFTSDGVELGDRDRVRDAGYHLEAVMHGDKESPVEAALGELHKCVNILRTSTNRLRRKSTKLVDVELTSALCKAKIIVDAECARLQIRHIRHRTTRIRITASVLMNS